MQKILTRLVLISIAIIIVFGFVYFMHDSYTSEKININELIAFSLTAFIAFLSLSWNIYSQYEKRMHEKISEEKRIATKNYDEAVSKTVMKALSILDDIMEEIEEAMYDEFPVKYIIKKLGNTPINKRVNRARRFCDEADQYMEKHKYESEFAHKFFYISKEKKIDDIFLDLLEYAGENNEKDNVLMKNILSDTKIELIRKKVEMRYEIDKREQEIAKSFYK